MVFLRSSAAVLAAGADVEIASLRGSQSWPAAITTFNQILQRRVLSAESGGPALKSSLAFSDWINAEWLGPLAGAINHSFS